MSTGNADKYAKIGGGGTDTLTATTLGSDGGAVIPPPYPLGGGSRASLPEVENLVQPHVADGTPAPAV